MNTVMDRLRSMWFACRVTSGRKSAWYGIRFSYPLSIVLLGLGIYLVNPYVLTIMAIIAFLAVVLPMHPFDYVYNYGVARLIGADRIPGRGTELQVTSSIALVFSLGVIALMIFEVQLNYAVMSLLYVVSSICIISIQLFKDDLSGKL